MGLWQEVIDWIDKTGKYSELDYPYLKDHHAIYNELGSILLHCLLCKCDREFKYDYFTDCWRCSCVDCSYQISGCRMHKLMEDRYYSERV